jgi:hypothetical protein
MFAESQASKKNLHIEGIVDPETVFLLVQGNYGDKV